MQIRTVLSGAIAVGLLASASAQAELALPTAPGTNSSLFVTVFDTTNQESFTTDLGLFYTSFVNNAAAPGTILPGSYAPRSWNLDMSVFADNNPDNILFNVHAGDASGGNGLRGILMTSNGVPAMQNTQMNGVLTQATGLIVTINQNCPETIGCAGTFGNESLWGSNIFGQFPAGSGAGFDETLGFYLITGANTPNALALTTATQFANASGPWNWMLTEGGTLTFQPIPLPAAAWLLISGLVGLGALGRRSSRKA